MIERARVLGHQPCSRRTALRMLGAWGACLGGVGASFRTVRALDQDEPRPADWQVTLGDPQTFVWDMGVEVAAGAGAARGLTATFPVPIDWPEQSVEVMDERVGDDLRLVMRDFDEQARLATVRIPRIEPGQTRRAVVRLRVRKSWLEAPSDPSSLTLPERVPAGLRGYLQPSPYIESDDRVIRELAEEVIDESLPAWDRVEAIYSWVRENIAYEFDERIHSCRAALAAKKGDCEELSSLFIALCRVGGIPARAVWIPGHTYPEFLLESPQGEMLWFPCQAAGEAHDFGRMPEWKPILQKGDRFRVPGQREPQRYLAPTLAAQDAAAAPSLKWVLEQVLNDDGSPAQ
ncbi:MAG: transglutaminase family protein [Planctomycetales bacterium]|nr:transglutaminase family protein [Planctomycetales bacterium]